MRSGVGTAQVGFDTEFWYPSDDRRVILSYQFAVDDPLTGDLVEIVIVPNSGNVYRLSLQECLGVVIRYAGLWRCRFGGREIFEEGSRTPFPSTIGASGRFWRKRGLPITLVAHFTKADISTFRPNLYCLDIMPRLIEVGGGCLVTERPVRLAVPNKPHYAWPVSLTVRDSMAYAADHTSLRSVGETIGVPKLDPGEVIIDGARVPAIEHMEVLADRDVPWFLEYAP